MKTMKLKFGEVNELSFSYSIKGMVSEKLNSEKQIRFFLTNNENNNHVFKVETLTNGQAKVLIPANSSLKENIEYQGVLEVILGNRIFHPLVLPIVFEAPIEIKAELVAETPMPQDIDEEQKISTDIDQSVLKEAIFSERKKQVENQPAPKPTPRPKVSPEKEYLKNLIFEAWNDL